MKGIIKALSFRMERLLPVRAQLGPAYAKYAREHHARYASFEAFMQANPHFCEP